MYMEIENLASEAEDFTGNVWKMEKGEVCLVDAGTGDTWDVVKNLDSVEKVVITHSHYDHIDNLSKIIEKFSPDVYAYEPSNLDVDAEKLRDGDEIKILGLEFKVFHTPGHKNDSICIYNKRNGILFTGDLIFPEAGFGRTDLAEGSRDMLIASIKKLLALEVEEFYPGHGDVVEENASEWIEKSLEEAEKHQSKY